MSLKKWIPSALVGGMTRGRGEKFLILILLVLAIGTRFWNFGQPAELVFDEVYFSQFPAHYFTGEYYFDIHPPLAKLMLAGLASFFGYAPPSNFDFSTIGNKFPEEGKGFFYFLRFVIALFGVILVGAIYWLSKQIFSSKLVAFLAGLLVIFDNAFLTQSRYILIDVILLAFGVLGLVFFLKSRKQTKNKSKRWLWFWTGLFLSASFSIKWTGLLFAGVVGLVMIYDIIRIRDVFNFLKPFFVMIIVGSVFYLSVFAIHFSVVPFSGKGDVYMSQSFRASLIGSSESKNENIVPAGFLKKFVELNLLMLSSNAGLKATHPYSSEWYSWPLINKPIYYWNGGETEDGEIRKIYLIGNPVIWWSSLLVIAYWLIWWLKELIMKVFKQKSLNQYFLPIGIILVGYIGNLLAYAFVPRIAFLYHYLPSLIFAFVGWGLFAKKYLYRWKIIIVLTSILIIAGFIFFAPLSYGTPISTEGLNQRLWFSGWR